MRSGWKCHRGIRRVGQLSTVFKRGAHHEARTCSVSLVHGPLSTRSADEDERRIRKRRALVVLLSQGFAGAGAGATGTAGEGKPGGVGLPAGTVTFLLTDIEGSTRLWETVPQAMEVALERHNRLLTEVIAGHGGGVGGGFGLKRLGAFRLRDLAEPELIYQLIHADLPADFPSIRTIAERSASASSCGCRPRGIWPCCGVCCVVRRVAVMPAGQKVLGRNPPVGVGSGQRSS
jgi:hypothetical protein